MLQSERQNREICLKVASEKQIPDNFFTKPYDPAKITVPHAGYKLRDPILKRIPINAVKRGQFRPDNPTLRMKSMDNILGKLSDEHCMNSTILSKDEFDNMTTSFVRIPHYRMGDMLYREAEKRIRNEAFAEPEWIKEHKGEWERFLHSNRTVSKLELPKRNDFHFVGYSISYTRPELYKSWKFTTTCNFRAHSLNERPTPATISDYHRIPHLNIENADVIYKPPWKYAGVIHSLCRT